MFKLYIRHNIHTEKGIKLMKNERRINKHMLNELKQAKLYL